MADAAESRRLRFDSLAFAAPAFALFVGVSCSGGDDVPKNLTSEELSTNQEIAKPAGDDVRLTPVLPMYIPHGLLREVQVDYLPADAGPEDDSIQLFFGPTTEFPASGPLDVRIFEMLDTPGASVSESNCPEADAEFRDLCFAVDPDTRDYMRISGVPVVLEKHVQDDLIDYEATFRLGEVFVVFMASWIPDAASPSSDGFPKAETLRVIESMVSQ